MYRHPDNFANNSEQQFEIISVIIDMKLIAKPSGGRDKCSLGSKWYHRKCNKNQRTKGPVYAHLRSAMLTKYLFKKFALYGAP